MSTTLYAFAPTVTQNFSFTATLDGTQYSIVVSWSLFGQRWIVNVYTLQGGRVLSKPLRSSPQDYDINLVQGYFSTSTLVYRDASNNFEVGNP